MKTLFLVTKYEIYDRSFIEVNKFVTDDATEYEDTKGYEVEEIEYKA